MEGDIPTHSSLPTNMIKDVTVLHSYSKFPLRIVPSTGQGEYRAGGTTIFTLPVGKVLDLKTFRIEFFAQTNGVHGECIRFPKFMSSLIHELTITINGQTITIPHYNLVYHMLRDYDPNYIGYASKAFNNPDPSVYTLLAGSDFMDQYTCSKDIVPVNDDVCRNSGIYCIDDWIGLLGSCQQSFFDTNLVGEFSVSITWAPNNILTRTGTTNLTPEYYVSQLVAFIDCIEFKDDAYKKAIESKLISGKVHEIPFKHYKVHFGTATTNNKNTILRVTESTNSLDKLLFTFLPTNRYTIGNLQLANDIQKGTTYADGQVTEQWFRYEFIKATWGRDLLNNSKFFKRSGCGLQFDNATFDKTGKITFSIDGQDVSPPMNMITAYAETLKAFGLNYDNIRGANPGISRYAEWLGNFFCVALSTSHIGGVRQGQYLISGIDTQASSLSIEVRTEQSTVADNAAQSALPMLVSEMTQVLLIGNGRTIAVKQ